jgi:hypothetical protein
MQRLRFLCSVPFPMPKLKFGAAVLACFSIASSLHAQRTDPPPDGAANRVVQDAAARTAAEAAWLEFRRLHPGPWQADWCVATGTPRAIYGAGLPLTDWRGNSLEEARRQANRLLIEQERLLGLGASDFREIIGQRIGRNWSFVFDQFFRGLPVIGGRADVRVSMTGRIAMFGSKAWPIAPDFVVTPMISLETAEAIAWATAAVEPPANPQPGRARASRLVIWGDVHATEKVTPVLAWEVPVSALQAGGAGLIGRYYVDAQTGAVLRYENDKHDCGDPGCPGDSAHGVPAPTAPMASATAAEPPVVPAIATESAAPAGSPTPLPTSLIVVSYVRGGLASDSPLVLLPLPGVEVQIGGQTVFTDAFGQADFLLDTMTTVPIQLKGRRSPLVQGPFAPAAAAVVYPGGPNLCAVAIASASDEEIAHTTTYYTVDRINEYCRAILGNTPQLAVLDSIQANVNLGGYCNAQYGGNSMFFYLPHAGCTNTAFSTVIAHEWGHGLDYEYGDISAWNGLGEAWADVVAMYFYDHPAIGLGLFGTPTPLRTGTNTHQFPQGAGLHEQGQSFMGFAWKLRDRLATLLANRPQAIALTNDIVLATIAADADSQPDAVLEVFLADDDDGNLANGTPNYAAIQWAAAQHSLPHPAILPPNDDCSGALTVFDGLNGPYDNTFAASVMPYSSDTADLWFVYTTGVAGNLTASTCGHTAMNSTLQIYSGTCGSLTSLGYNDDACGSQSQLTVAVAPGTYYIRVAARAFINQPPNPPGWVYTPSSFQLSITGPTGGAASHVYYGMGCTGFYGVPYPYIYGADPKFGTTVPITTDPYFVGSPVGIVVLGISWFLPGVPLDFLGAPGCQLLTDPLVLVPTLRDPFGRFNYALYVPHDAALQNATVYAQTFVVSPGANFLELTSTDGLGLTIGN